MDDQKEESVLTLEELLSKVGLQEKKTLFEQEQIDIDSLVGNYDTTCMSLTLL